MKLALVTQPNCLASMSAIHWTKKHAADIEIVDAAEIPDVIEIYGVRTFPTLLHIGEYGVVTKVEGYNGDKYAQLIGGMSNE